MAKSVFEKTVSGYNLIDIVPSSPIEEKLPAGFYRLDVQTDPKSNRVNVSFNELEPFKLPDTIYGRRHNQRLHAIGRVYHDRFEQGKNLNVLLQGFKGSGKTLLAHAVATKMVSSGHPVIIVDQVVSPRVLTKVARINGQCMFLFDEFEKTYRSRDGDGDTNDDNQELMLEFLSNPTLEGVLTCMISNGHISSYMTNRPERVYFRYKYESLSDMEMDEFTYICKQMGMDDPLTRLAMNNKESLTLDGLLVMQSIYVDYKDDPDTLEAIFQGINIDLKTNQYIESAKGKVQWHLPEGEEPPEDIDLNKFTLTIVKNPDPFKKEDYIFKGYYDGIHLSDDDRPFVLGNCSDIFYFIKGCRFLIKFNSLNQPFCDYLGITNGTIVDETGTMDVTLSVSDVVEFYNNKGMDKSETISTAIVDLMTKKYNHHGVFGSFAK